MTWSPRRVLLAALCALTVVAAGTTSATADPADPAPPGYDAVADLAAMRDAYGRIIDSGGQLQNPAYLPALVKESTVVTTAQLLQQVADPTHLAVTPAVAVPGWNVGNPLRAGWAGTRGRMQQVSFTNRFGALLRGTLYAPLPGARDPYTGARLTGPYPGVIITPGSVGGSQGMYQWLAEDLAERGYLVLLFDVQGEGTSETLPHTGDPLFPFCNPFAPADGDPALGTNQMTPCPGVPFQQLANFTTGTVDAIDFFLSDANPWLGLWDSSPIPHPITPGRTTRLAIIGHSMGAAAVSYVQGYDDRVATVVALDKLQQAPNGVAGSVATTPVVPALALQAEYGFTVTPSFLSGGSSLVPAAGNPDPMRERASGFDGWRAHGLDTMLVVPHASTHLDFTDIPLVLPASRWGQALSSVYTQTWLGHYLQGTTPARALLAARFRYLEPVGHGRWKKVTLTRDALLSTRYCSAYSLDISGHVREDLDIVDVGC
ncbi:alpha/beta hydrolase [Nocardioides humilatus]|uniref:Alpha/beta hydrolase n=1 Tax=Nocardioides humilatus TaxID=2607660 RepID=A0A5B1LLH6_9ACTN|nr:alpha/beta hydrolase [Nocardioides humilatus]KAA1421562.1 alpha/beta hydrolase [Nocardioides humilatus]